MVKRPDYKGEYHYYSLSTNQSQQGECFIYFNDEEPPCLSFPGHFLFYIGREDSHFLNPRMKQIDAEHFVLSGLWDNDGELYQFISKFKGRISPRCEEHYDRLKYEEGLL